jgi:hypothetical protein
MNLKTILLILVGALSIVGTASADDSNKSLAGTWTNPDAKTRGWVKITIDTTGDKASIQAWGSCQPAPCDLGKVDLTLFGDSVNATNLPYGLAVWDKDFEVIYMTVRRDGDELAIETYTVFKDKSGRKNYRSTVRFKAASKQG